MHKNSNFAPGGYFTGGKMGERMHETDWTSTALGSPAERSDALRSTLSVCLISRFPIAIYWGDEGFLL